MNRASAITDLIIQIAPIILIAIVVIVVVKMFSTKNKNLNHGSVRELSSEQISTNRNIAFIIYGLLALSFIWGITAIIGVVVACVRRDDVRGTWLESHFKWQIGTFWGFLIAAIVGVVLMVFLVGWVVLAAAYIWVIYRVAVGAMQLFERRPIGGSVSVMYSARSVSERMEPTTGDATSVRIISPVTPKPVEVETNLLDEEDFPFSSENTFKDVTTDVSDEAREALATARSQGFEVRMNRRANYVSVTKGATVRRFRTNQAICQFALDLLTNRISPKGGSTL